MIAIELWNSSTIAGSTWLVRLVYNGEPLLLPGCYDTLCEATQFLAATAFTQERRSCVETTHTSDSSASSTDANSGDDLYAVYVHV
jgi:hypothetical protein